MKSFLFVLQHSPYRGSDAQESLDRILITAAFDQPVSLLLLGDAVFHMKQGQVVKEGDRKNIGAIYRSLELYDIETIYVEQESLIRAGLALDDLLFPVQLIKQKETPALLQKFDLVLNG